MKTESTVKHERGHNVVATLASMWPDVTKEMTDEVGKRIMEPFKVFDLLNASGPLVNRVASSPEHKAKLEAKLATTFIEPHYKADGTLLGLALQVQPITSTVMNSYEQTDPRYKVACYFAGRLQEKMSGYKGPEDDPIIRILGMVATSMANDSEVTTDECFERVEDIVNKGESSNEYR